jgi:hypothetical protein
MVEVARVVNVRTVAPDPSIARAVGRHHTFETALADLIDNSIDADARNVLVRFLQRDGLVVGLRLIDDGKGMDAHAIDLAMTFAKRREYDDGDLGHFGIGLKAASLSQADRLSVYSRRFGAVAAGRSIRSSDPTAVADLDGDDVASILGDLRVDFTMDNGTVVEWGEPRSFISSPDLVEQAQWLDARIESVRSHLGIVFHRLLAAARVSIAVDVFDVSLSEASAPRAVTPIDPFGYSGLPNDAYPQELRIAIDGGDSAGVLHLWPAAQSGKPGFRLGGKPGALFQGLYFYRNDRLLQVGGWNTLVNGRPELEYARIAIDIDGTLAAHITINPEKAGLELDSDLKQSLRGAVFGPSNSSFGDFLESAEGARREARRYTKRPVTMVRPDRGFDGEMLDAFEASVELAGGAPVDVRWQVMTSEAPFAIDLDRRTIWLNEQYRSVIVGPGGTGANQAHDAPLVKTLLMIVFSAYFEGEYLGSKEKTEIAAWEQLLTAALRDEISQQTLLARDAATRERGGRH